MTYEINYLTQRSCIDPQGIISNVSCILEVVPTCNCFLGLWLPQVLVMYLGGRAQLASDCWLSCLLWNRNA